MQIRGSEIWPLISVHSAIQIKLHTSGQRSCPVAPGLNTDFLVVSRQKL